ncbi:MAG TPA: PAS domain S-box protein, partial [Chroococcidiopsis sp.]
KEIRQKLKKVGAPKDFIKTVYQVGYQLNPIYAASPIVPSEQQPTPQQIAELTSVNQQLRDALEALQATQKESERQSAKAAFAEDQNLKLAQLNEELQQTLEELRIAEEELREQSTLTERERLKYQDLFNFAPDGYLVTNVTGTIQEANQAAAEQFGVRVDYLVGKPLLTFVAKSDYAVFHHYLERQQNRLCKITLLCPRQGSMFPAEVRMSPIYNHLKQVTGLRWLIRDISDRQHLEAERQQTEAALRESERRLSTLMNNLPGYVYRVANDPNYTPEFISDGVFNITGYRPEEYLIQRTISCGQEIHPEDAEQIWSVVQHAIIAHQPYECEYRIITKDNVQKWVWERGRGIYAEDGSLCFLEGFVTEITDRKQAEAALRENQQRYHQILDSIADMVFVKRPDSQMIWANKALRDYYDMSPEEIQGMIDAPFNAADYTLQYLQDDALVFSTGKVLDISEELITRHDGVVRVFNTIKAPIYDDQGQISMLVGVCRDITERKQAEEALRYREEFLSSIYNGTNQAIFVVAVTAENDFHYVNLNPVAEQYGGKGDREVRGKTPEEAFGALAGAAFRQHYQHCLHVGTSITYEEQVVFENHIIWTLTTLTPLRDPQGKIYRIVGTAIDISDRKQLELELQTSEAKLSRILDSAIAAISSFRVYSNRDWDYEYWSAGCERLYGYKREEYSDKSFWLSQVMPEDRDQILMPLFDHFFAEQEVTAEYRFRRKDGAIRWFSSSYTSQRIEDDCWIVTTVNYDITNRKQLEAEQQQAILTAQHSEEQLRLALDLTHIGSWDWVPTTGTSIWNDNHYRLFGYEPGEVEPSYQLWRDRVHPDDIARVELQIAAALTNNTDVEIEHRVVLPDGSIRWILGRGRGLYDQLGQPIRVVGVVFDITERKQSESTLQQQIRQEYLLADMAQDIRQSLDLNDVLSRTVERVRQVLDTDRVVVFRFRPDWQGDIIMESVRETWEPILNTTIFDPCFGDHYLDPYRQGRIGQIDNIDRNDLPDCYTTLLKSFQVRANLVVPILQ